VITTPDLVKALAADAAPVRRLRPPLVRAACWLLFAAFIVTLIGVSHGLRPDFAQKARDAAFVAGMLGSILTAALAAIAAFMLSLPDRSRLWLLLPAPALAAWAATIGYGCLTAWVGLGPAGVSLADIAECFATLVLTSAPISAALLLMLRHAAALRPGAAVMLGCLAVAAATATGLSLFHPLDATIMILVWNIGLVPLFAAVGAAFYRRALAWVAPRSLPLRH
jgi:hypothetical protein